MRTATLYNGKTNSLVDLGTWLIGGGRSADYTCDEFFVEVLNSALNLGYLHIDTTEL